MHTKRTTIYLDPKLHKALQLKSIETDESISELINEAIKIILSEDEADLKVFEERKKESAISFEKILKDLKKSGKI